MLGVCTKAAEDWCLIVLWLFDIIIIKHMDKYPGSSRKPEGVGIVFREVRDL